MKLSKYLQEKIDAVTCTLGPQGKLTAYDNGVDTVITKDGVSIADFTLENLDPAQTKDNSLFKLIRQAAKKTVSESGDNTTSTFLLTKTILENCNRSDVAKIQEITRQIQSQINEKKKRVSSLRELQNIARVASNDDREIYFTVANLVWDNKEDGHYIVEDKYEKGIEVEKITGFYVDCGMTDPFFVNQTNGTCKFTNPAFLVGDQITISELSLAATKAKQEDKALVVIGSLSEDSINAMKTNQLKQYGEYCHIDTTYYPNNKKISLLNDLQEVVHCIEGDKKVVFTAYKGYCVLEYDQDNKALKEYTKKVQKSDTERYARFQSKVCKIKVGSDSTAGLRAKRDALEDTILSCINALKTGYLPGGGSFLHNYAKQLPRKYKRIYNCVYNQIGIKEVPEWVIDSAQAVTSFVKNSAEVACLILNTQHFITKREKNG